MARRKSRGTATGSLEVGGCLWAVGSYHSVEHVIAPDAQTAMRVYHAIPKVMAATADDPESTVIHDVRRVATCVFGMPIDASDATQD